MSLSKLPGELVGYIVVFLDLRSAGRLSTTCRDLHWHTLGDPYVEVLLRARLGLVECARRGWYDAVAYLLGNRTVTGEEVQGAFGEAVRGGHTDVVQLVLGDDRVDPAGHIDGASWEPAIQQGAGLLRIGRRIPGLAPRNTAIRMASHFGYTGIVELLLVDGRVDPASDYHYSIRVAAEYGHTEILGLLLNDGRANPAAGDNQPIRHAMERGDARVVEMLLEDGRADAVADHSQSFWGALRRGHAGVVRALLADGRVDPGANNSKALCLAAEFGHADVVALLLADPRVDPTATDNRATWRAAQYGYADVVRVLLADQRVLAVGNVVDIAKAHGL